MIDEVETDGRRLPAAAGSAGRPGARRDFLASAVKSDNEVYAVIFSQTPVAEPRHTWRQILLTGARYFPPGTPVPPPPARRTPPSAAGRPRRAMRLKMGAAKSDKPAKNPAAMKRPPSSKARAPDSDAKPAAQNKLKSKLQKSSPTGKHAGAGEEPKRRAASEAAQFAPRTNGRTGQGRLGCVRDDLGAGLADQPDRPHGDPAAVRLVGHAREIKDQFKDLVAVAGKKMNRSKSNWIPRSIRPST